MANLVRIVEPVAESFVEAGRPAPRLASLEGKSVALMDNKKSNADILLDRIGENLCRDYGVARVHRYLKAVSAADPFPEEVLSEVCRNYGAAVAAVGD